MEFPQVFGKYTLLKRIAVGGMAEIFLARQQGVGGFEKEVVIKRLLPEHRANEELVSMFLDEAAIAANLSHPNIAKIYDLGSVEDDYFIAMEYIYGRDLRQVCAQGVKEKDFIDLRHAVRVIAESCDGLDYAHSKKDADGHPMCIVHRDISPTNILISYDGAVKLVDFGIAKAASKVTVTRTGQIKGKFGYMAPEQAVGGAVDGRTDIFAAGINLYEITTGRRLFRGSNEMETLQAIEEANVPPPRSLNPTYPEGLEKIVMKALARDPDDRYATARELQLALQGFLAENELRSTAGQISGYMKALFQVEMKQDMSEREQLRAIAQQAFSDRETEQIIPPVQEDAMSEKKPNIPNAPIQTGGGVEPKELPSWGAINAVTPAPMTQKRAPQGPPSGGTPSFGAAGFGGDSADVDLSDISIGSTRSYAGLFVMIAVLAAGGLIYWLMSTTESSTRKDRPILIQVTAPTLQEMAMKNSEALPELAPIKKSMLRVTTNPPGAYIVVNGNPVKGAAPTAVQSFQGHTTRVRAWLPGHIPVEKTLKIEGDEAAVTLDLTPGDGQSGMLKLVTDPPGATVIRDGQSKGDSPLELTGLAAEVPVTLRVIKTGYYPHIVQFAPKDGESYNLGIKLAPDTGKRSMALVKVDTIPAGARVQRVDSDGKAKGIGRTSQTAVKVNAQIGQPLHLRIQKEGLGPVDEYLDVQAAFYTVLVRLKVPQKTYGTFSIKGDKSLLVYVGPEEIGHPPIKKYRAETGPQKVVVTHKETRARAEFTIDIEVDRDITKTVKFKDGKIVIE